MANVRVYESAALAVADQPVEFVERKGKGHPDSLIDGICEQTSIELSRHYLDNFGTVLHHNVDKGLIIGGSSEATFGKARITRPIEIIVTGRATQSHQGRAIPVDEIALKATKDLLKANTRFLDLDKEVVINSKIVKGSDDLNQIFSRSSDVPLANDTSFGVGFAPLTLSETLTLETEKYLNTLEYKKRMPAVGEDIKVMCVREEDSIGLNVAIAFVSPLLKDIDEYARYKENVASDIRNNVKKYTDKDVRISVNSGDSLEREEVYLTKSGLSCEAGDDGSVGRGNRVNGLITPFRTMSMEAPAGKNPANHTGKIYSILSREIATDVVKLYPQIRECQVAIVSHIGQRIDDPRNLTVTAIMQRGEKFDLIKSKVRDVAADALSDISYVTRGLADGKYEVF